MYLRVSCERMLRRNSRTRDFTTKFKSQKKALELLLNFGTPTKLSRILPVFEEAVNLIVFQVCSFKIKVGYVFATRIFSLEVSSLNSLKLLSSVKCTEIIVVIVDVLN